MNMSKVSEKLAALLVGITLLIVLILNQLGGSDPISNKTPELKSQEDLYNYIISQKSKKVFVRSSPKANIPPVSSESLEQKMGFAAMASFENENSPDYWQELALNENETLEALSAENSELYIEPNQLRYIMTIPDDPLYSSSTISSPLFDQQNLRNIGLNPVTSLPGNESGWEITTGSSNIIVAVLDTGMDDEHTDLTPNLWVNADETPNNNIDDDANGYIDDFNGFNFAESLDGNGDGDYDNVGAGDIINVDIDDDDPANNGHGTHVAGIIAARGNNNSGITGICWNCQIMPLKVVNAERAAYDSDIAAAIYYAVDNGAKVINMSLGGEGYSGMLQDAINYAWQNDVLVVSSSGNYGGESSNIYPGASLNSISVGAVDNLNQSQSFVSKGQRMDIVAPGVSVLSSVPIPKSGGCLGSGNTLPYDCHTGTSMAAPHIAGVVALLLSNDPDMTVYDLRAALLTNTTDLGVSGFDNSFGMGIVNTFEAVQYPGLSADAINPTASVTTTYNSYLTGTVPISGSVNDANLYIFTVYLTNPSGTYIYKQFSGRNNISNNVLGNLDVSELSDGNYRIFIRAEDYAGNSFSSTPIQVYVDNTPPTSFGYTAPNPNTWLTTLKPTLSWSQPYDFSSIKYDVYLNGSRIASDLTTNSYQLQNSALEGQNTWYVIAKDSAGLQRTSSTSTFKTDTQPPLPFNVNISINNSNNAILSFNATDVGSGINKYQISLKSSTFTDITSPHTLTDLTDGEYTGVIRVIDKQRYPRDSSFSFTINKRKSFLKSVADFNLDGKVDISDLSILASYWSQNNVIADANGDGNVTLQDLSILASNWQKIY